MTLSEFLSKQPNSVMLWRNIRERLYVAVKGHVGDWALYSGNETDTLSWVAKRGNKISISEAARITEFPEDIMERYRL